jgi:glycosyltransferase involved in cell wall biosynthesis
MKPRLALVHYSAPPVIGGVEAVLGEQARLFTAAGYPVTVVTGRGGQAGLPEGVMVRVIPEMDSAHRENLELAAALAQGEVPPAFAALRDRLAEPLTRALADADLAIVHNLLTMHFNLPLVAALHQLADQSVRPRWVAWSHDVSRYARPGAELRTGFPWDYLRRQRPDVTYVAVSAARQAQLAEALGCPPEQIAVIPNGVDAAALFGWSAAIERLAEAHALLSADVIVLMPVRITRAKNLELGLRVTAALKALGRRPRLLVTGPPDPHNPDILSYLDELRGLRRWLDLTAEVIFLSEAVSEPSLTLAEVGQLYGLADAVLFPSHREGFGIPVLEAGLLGRPVFTTAVPVVEALGADQVELIAPDEPAEQVAGRILECLDQDPARRLRRHVRQRYPWSVVYRHQIEPLIQRTLETAESRAL